MDYKYEEKKRLVSLLFGGFLIITFVTLLTFVFQGRMRFETYKTCLEKSDNDNQCLEIIRGK